MGPEMAARRYLMIVTFLVIAGVPLGGEFFAPAANAAEETVKDMLAAQIRTQGFACEQPKRAVRDAKRSKPDFEVWVLRCSNATYRISRYPDLAAKVQRLR